MRKPRLGDVVVVGFAWGSARVGKVVSSFAVELLGRGSQRDIKTFVCRVVEFRTCWYKTQDENGRTEYQSPLMTALAELPDALAEEVRALVGTEILVGADTARYGLGQYIFCPGTPEFVAWAEAIRAADAPGILEFTINPWPDSSSFLPSPQEAAAAGFTRAKVEVVTLNQLAQTAEARVPDMVKIDAEGFDLKVLAGASKLMGKTDIFFVEAGVVCPQFDNSVYAVVTRMSDAGYRLIDITDLNVSPTHGALWLCELVFLRKSSPLLQTMTSY